MSFMFRETGYIIRSDDNEDVVVGPFEKYEDAQQTIIDEGLEGCQIISMITFVGTEKIVSNGGYLN